MTALTLGTWNCRMGLDRKRAAVERLGCDVLVVPECHSTPTLATELGVSFAWKGRFPRKGLAVFGFNGWRLEPAEETTPLPWVLALHVLDPAGARACLLLATWTVTNQAERWPRYSAQVTQAIDAWEHELRSEPVILAGDLNCSAQGPSALPHLANLTRLEALGVQSAYHAHHSVAHGTEPDQTLRWIGPGRVPHLYHCDFVFLSARALAGLEHAEVGAAEAWIENGLSDHAPVVARVALEASET